jgi:hypothetical protein
LAFIAVWNRIVDEYESYVNEWEQVISGDDVLKAYQVRELITLVEPIG